MNRSLLSCNRLLGKSLFGDACKYLRRDLPGLFKLLELFGSNLLLLNRIPVVIFFGGHPRFPFIFPFSFFEEIHYLPDSFFPLAGKVLEVDKAFLLSLLLTSFGPLLILLGGQTSCNDLIAINDTHLHLQGIGFLTDKKVGFLLQSMSPQSREVLDVCLQRGIHFVYPFRDLLQGILI